MMQEQVSLPTLAPMVPLVGLQLLQFLSSVCLLRSFQVFFNLKRTDFRFCLHVASANNQVFSFDLFYFYRVQQWSVVPLQGGAELWKPVHLWAWLTPPTYCWWWEWWWGWWWCSQSEISPQYLYTVFFSFIVSSLCIKFDLGLTLGGSLCSSGEGLGDESIPYYS